MATVSFEAKVARRVAMAMVSVVVKVARRAVTATVSVAKVAERTVMATVRVRQNFQLPTSEIFLPAPAYKIFVLIIM